MTSPGRSFELKMLIVIMAALSWLGWLRLGEAIQSWSLLNEIGIQPPPFYFAFSGAAWGAIALVAAVSLFLRTRWSGWYTRIITLVIVGWYWLDRAFLSQPLSTQRDLGFALLLSGLFLAFTFGVLALRRQKRLFGK